MGPGSAFAHPQDGGGTLANAATDDGGKLPLEVADPDFDEQSLGGALGAEDLSPVLRLAGKAEHGEGAGDDKALGKTTFGLGGDDHAPYPRIERKPGEAK